MLMLTPLVVLWLGHAAPLPAQRALLEDWASVHATGVRWATAAPAEAADTARTVEQIEAALENARAGAEAAPDELARAEQLLLAHPELPQAAWLMAERHALAAQSAAATGDVEASEAAARRADALEGPRAAPAGSAPSGSASASPATQSTASPDTRLAWPGLRARDELYVDGSPQRVPAAGPGLHHLRWVRRGQLVWAGWLSDSAAGPGADPTPACSTLDLAAVDAGVAAPATEPGIQCARWAAARPAPSGGLDVSLCNASRCAGWERLGREREPRAELAEGAAWPAWLTWALVGAGAAATASVVLWQTGAFDRPEPGTQFVFTGPSAASLGF